MESKLTPELSVALDRAMAAAGTDPLVSLLDIMEQLTGPQIGIDDIVYQVESDIEAARPYQSKEDREACAKTQERCQYALRLILKAKKILESYRPVSESYTNS